MSKFLRIGVSKRSYTDIYVEVADDFDISGANGYASVRKLNLDKICDETLRKHDWETDFLDPVEVEEVRVVSEKEAKYYIYWSEIDHAKHG